MQDQRRSMSSEHVNSPSRQTPYIDVEDDCSQALLPWASENSMPPFAANHSHSSLQPSYDSNLTSSSYGAQYMSAPCYSASQLDPGYQPSYGPAPDFSTLGAYSTAALAPNSAFDPHWNTPNPDLAPSWGVPAMQLPSIEAAVPYSTANDQSKFPPTESLAFQGWDQPGFSSVPTGTPSLPAAYDTYGYDDDPTFPRSWVDPASANDVECMTTCPASSSLGALTDLRSAKPRGPTDGIASPTNHVPDSEMLSETACDCLDCSGIGTYRALVSYFASSETDFCRYYYRHARATIYRSAKETCAANFDRPWKLHHHERSHYKHEGGYRCLEQGCKYKSSTWNDLTRHTLNIHCQNPPIYSCPKIGCKYHGDNGFKRKDKLKSHVDKVHLGRVAPGRAGRHIQPAVANANNGAGYRA